MAAKNRTGSSVPHDEDLTWFLCAAESALGSVSTYREGGGGCGARDYERGITDRRFGGLRPADADAGDIARARRLRTAWAALSELHRDALVLAYYHAPHIKTAVTEAYDLEAAQMVDRLLGDLAGVALLVVDAEDERPRVRRQNWDDMARCGVWRSPRGFAVVAMASSSCGCKLAREREPAIVCAKHQLEQDASRLLRGALAAWQTLPKGGERYVGEVWLRDHWEAVDDEEEPRGKRWTATRSGSLAGIGL